MHEHRPYTVLFLSPRNAARSLMAEGLLNLVGGRRFRALSAGLWPAAAIDPLAAEVLRLSGVPVDDLRPKRLAELGSEAGRAVDLIVTMGGVDAAPASHLWAGAAWVRWGIDSPAEFAGPDDRRRMLFRHAFQCIETRLVVLLSLRPDDLGAAQLQAALDADIRTPPAFTADPRQAGG